MAETSEQNWEEQDNKQPEIEQPAEQKTEKEKGSGKKRRRRKKRL